MSSTQQTFVEACLTGSALLDDVDDWVDRWHDGPADDRDLDAYLGLTSEEGALWAERPEALRFVVAAHRYERPVADLLLSRDAFALAARSGANDDARKVLDWLRETGRLEPETS